MHITQSPLLKLCFFLLLLSACQLECEELPLNQIKIQFFDRATLLSDTLAFNSVKGRLPVLSDPDSILYNQEDTLSIFVLPSAFELEEVSFELNRLNTDGSITQERLSIAYTNTLVIERPNCGLVNKISNLRVTESTFDSTAVIISNLLNEEDEVNIRIYQ